MKYVGLAVLAGTFWLLVAALHVAVNGDCQLRGEAVARESPLAQERPQPPVDATINAMLWKGTNCGLPDLDRPDSMPNVADNNPISKAAVVAGMNSVKPLVNACYLQYQVRGMAMVNVVINKDGSVCSATTTGKFAGTPTGACVEQAVRTARFPRSSGLTTPYPFMLR